MTEEATNKALGDSTFFARDLAVSMFIDFRTLPNYQKKKERKKESLTGRIFLLKIKIKEILCKFDLTSVLL